MSAQTEENSSDEPSTNGQAAARDTTVPRALVAWLVVAILTVAIATIATVEASAAPLIDPQGAASECSRGFALTMLAAFGALAVGVSAIMWRDLPRQSLQLPRARRYG